MNSQPKKIAAIKTKRMPTGTRNVNDTSTQHARLTEKETWQGSRLHTTLRTGGVYIGRGHTLNKAVVVASIQSGNGNGAKSPKPSAVEEL